MSQVQKPVLEQGRDKGMRQLSLFGDSEENPDGGRRYRPILTVAENFKGVLDIDTVKGCSLGMKAYPMGGCYGECYANKIAARYGIDFKTSVSRRLLRSTRVSIYFAVKDHYATWYRIGTAGDPCHDWDNTLDVCEFLQGTGKTPVIITKHWTALSDSHLLRLKTLSAVVNTSTSGLDSDSEIRHRVEQMDRIKEAGAKSVCRVVTCSFGPSQWARQCHEKQEYLLSLSPVVDNPLRATKSNKHVMNGDIILERKNEAIGGGKLVSLHNSSVYLGTCYNCPDQCGVGL